MAKLNPQPRNYEQADAALKLRRTNSLAIGHNTRMERYTRNRDSIDIWLHNTAIITYNLDSSIEINSGGYRTSTTKDRINQLLPDGCYVYQQDWTWYLVLNGDHGRPVKFRDNMRITHSEEGWTMA